MVHPEHHIATGDILPDLAYVSPGVQRSADLNDCTRARAITHIPATAHAPASDRILDHDHRIHLAGHGRTRVHAYAIETLTHEHRIRLRCACCLVCTNRIPIHRGASVIGDVDS